MATFTLPNELAGGYTDEPSRGALRRALRPPEGWFRQQAKRRSWQDVALWRIENALEFSVDDVLSDPVELVREFRRHPFAEVLTELIEGGMPDERILGVRPPRRGRPRMRGDWASLYLAYVQSGYVGVQTFTHKCRSSPIWEECGFDRRPSRSQVHEQFVRLEQHMDAFRVISDSLALICKRAEPRFGQILFVDATAWHSSARPLHYCPDANACQKAGRAQTELAPSSDEAINAARALEAEAEDFEVTPDEPERTRGDVLVATDDYGKEQRLGQYFVGGHWYHSCDTTSGLRKYGTGPLWYGGYFEGAIDAMTGMTIAGETFPADIQEYDHLPMLFDGVVSAIGERPYIISVDRGFYFKATSEFAARRGVDLVGMTRKVNGKKKHADWRTEAFDEDGVPRCRGCGGPGNQHLPGLGFTLGPQGEPMIRFLCTLPFPGSPVCDQIQTIACASEWRLMKPLSRLTELHHAVAAMHSTGEHVFRHMRQRSSAIGNDLSGRLARPGIPAQRLRAQAAVLLDLFRGSLRLGWLDSNGIGVKVIDATPLRLSGAQDLSTLRREARGQGSARLDSLDAQRRESGADQPYGPAWERQFGVASTELEPVTP